MYFGDKFARIACAAVVQMAELQTLWMATILLVLLGPLVGAGVS